MKNLLLIFFFLLIVGKVQGVEVPTIETTAHETFEATIYTTEEACIAALEDSNIDPESYEMKESQCMDQAY